MPEHKGLGDTIAAFTAATKLDKVAKKMANMAGKEDCGCAKRQQTLNNLVPYRNGGRLINVSSDEGKKLTS